MAYGGLLLLAVIVLFVVILVLAFTSGGANASYDEGQSAGKTIFLPGGAVNVTFEPTGWNGTQVVYTVNRFVLMPRAAGTLIRITNGSGAALPVFFDNQNGNTVGTSITANTSQLYVNMNGQSNTTSWAKVGAESTLTYA